MWLALPDNPEVDSQGGLFQDLPVNVAGCHHQRVSSRLKGSEGLSAGHSQAHVIIFHFNKVLLFHREIMSSCTSCQWELVYATKLFSICTISVHLKTEETQTFVSIDLYFNP